MKYQAAPKSQIPSVVKYHINKIKNEKRDLEFNINTAQYV
jgi:hypothetical protein